LDTEPSLNFIETVDTNIILGSIGVFILLFFSAMVSAAEVALFSLTPNDLNKLNEENPKKGDLLSKLIQKPKKLLATLLLANNFLNIGVVILFSMVGDTLFLNPEFLHRF